MRNSDSSGAVTIPPIMVAAIRCITSEPVPWLHMIGSNPAMITMSFIFSGSHGEILGLIPEFARDPKPCGI